MSESPASRSTDTPAEPVNGGFPTAFGPDFGDREQPEPSPPDSFPVVPGRDLSSVLDALRRRLVDTGTRNRLIHVNRRAKRANVLNIVHERSNDIYDLLRMSGRRMRFRPRGEDEYAPEFSDVLFVSDEDMDTSKHRDANLETELGPQALEKRLLKLHRDSKTTEEEQGANFLFLALGFLRWYEDEKSNVLREAPLVLLPVQLTRLQRGFTFSLIARSDDVTTNLPLKERLNEDAGIVLPEIDDSEEWTPDDYFDKVEAVIRPKKRWSVDRDGMQLGFFSFAKALMYRDLVEANWPAGTLTGNPLIRGLLDTDREFEDSLQQFEFRGRLDEHLDPRDIVHVVDADASQAKAIELVRSGRNIVVQGPPGTGKSQTITNIIATAAHKGKTVLFVAEKMAALKVVHDRLVKTGLREICLELHSRTANKKAFYGELKRTLDAAGDVPATPAEPEDLKAARDALNEIDELLHKKLEGRDYSPFQVIAKLCRFLGERVPPPTLRAEGLAELTDADRDAIGEMVRLFAKALEKVGRPAEHPFFGTQALDLQPTDVDRLRVELRTAQDSAKALLQTAEGIVRRLTVETSIDLVLIERLALCIESAGTAPEGVGESAKVLAECAHLGRLMDGLVLFKTWRDARYAAEDEFADVAWDSRVEEVRTHIAAGVGSIFARWFGKYRNASAQFATLLKGDLPRSSKERLVLVDMLLSVQRKRKEFAAEEDWLSMSLGSCWRGIRTDVEALLEAGAWVTNLGDALRQVGKRLTSETVDAVCALKSDAEPLRSRLQAELTAVRQRVCVVDKHLQFGPEDMVGQQSLTAIADRLGRMHGQVARYLDWSEFRKQRQVLDANGLKACAHRIEEEGTSPLDAEQEFLYAVAEARWDHARSVRPELEKIANRGRHELVTVFQNHDRRRLEEVRTLVRNKHLNQLPKGAAGEMAFLRGEFGKKKRHRSVRQAFLAAPNMMPRIKPVLLMSPISIAQFLPPNRISFDLLLIDEASQVRPEDALGAVARASQIVVVGDDKQLPPTSFFDRLVDNQYDDEDDDADATPEAADATEMESILKLAEVRGLGAAMLEWHYRSRDPSLIKISNVEFYESRLVLPPSPLERDDRFGMTLTRVAGVYSSRQRGGGRAGTNQVEAEHIADALEEHARALDRRGQSVGVVAFSKAQSDMITEVLEVRRRTNASLDALLREGKNEDVFVKNIENVQGDERDVILVSVGYGPHEPGGHLSSMRFGPVNNDGGERRLNVLFSRARMRCEIFVSFDWREIDLMRTRGDGPRILRKFLSFAETGRHDADSTVTGSGPESPLEEDVAQVIDELGYPVDHQVGSEGFRIDLGVRHPKRPSQYILAVECDGATYHSALWARERDRLRQQVLEDQGWRFHRIWSTDWFYRREAEVERLRMALDRAREASGDGFRPPAANRTGNGRNGRDHSAHAGAAPEAPPKAPVLSNAPAYQRADVWYGGFAAPHDVGLQQLADLVKRIVESEGPMHRSLVARRIATAFELARAGSRVVDAVDRALRWVVRYGTIVRSGDFFMTSSQHADPPVRNRSAEPATNPAHLPPIEICAAAKWVERENGEVQGQEQIRAVARLLGYERTKSALRARIAEALNECP